MKKLKLNIAHFSEILTREQLKQVVGGSGSGSGSGSGDCPVPCTYSSRAGARCVTNFHCKEGKCGYYMGIWGCVA